MRDSAKRRVRALMVVFSLVVAAVLVRDWFNSH